MGIAVIIAICASLILSSGQQQTAPISDRELQTMSEDLPEVSALLSKYPDADVQFFNDGTTRTIDYFATVSGPSSSTHTIYLGMVVDVSTGALESIILTCNKTGDADNVSINITEDIESAILEERCLTI